MSEFGARIAVLGSTVAELLRKLLDLTQRIARLEQQAWAQGAGGGGGGGGDAVFVCYPSAAIAGASWSSGVPTAATTFQATVYQVSGTSTATSLGTQTCLNWLASPLAASKGCLLVRDGAGNYVVTGQSCQ